MVITPKNNNNKKVSNVDTHLIVPLTSRGVLCAKQQQQKETRGCCGTCPLAQTERVPLPLAACVSFSGLRSDCQFHTLKTAIQISLTSGWDRVCWVCLFFMTLSKNQTFRIHSKVGNGLILRKNLLEKRCLWSATQLLLKAGNIEHKVPESWVKAHTWIWDVGGPDVWCPPYLLLKHLHTVKIKPFLTR